MHTGFVMVPQMIKSQSTALVASSDKLLPQVVTNCCTSLVVVK